MPLTLAACSPLFEENDKRIEVRLKEKVLNAILHNNDNSNLILQLRKSKLDKGGLLKNEVSNVLFEANSSLSLQQFLLKFQQSHIKLRETNWENNMREQLLFSNCLLHIIVIQSELSHTENT